MASILITGTSRGLGLALVNELVSLPTSQIGTIFATARSNALALDEIVEKSSGRVVFVKLDVTDQDSIKKAAGEVEKVLGPEKPLDVLVNNAGYCHWSFSGIRSMYVPLLPCCSLTVIETRDLINNLLACNNSGTSLTRPSESTHQVFTG